MYPRISNGSIPEQFENHPKITKVNAPIMEVSSTAIRKDIAAGKNTQPLLDAQVWKFIDEMGFWR